MIETLVTVLVGVVALIASLVLLDVVIRKPQVAAALVLGATVLNIALDAVYYSINVGGADIRLTDLIFSVAAAAAVARLLRLGRLSSQAILLVVLGILCIVSVFQGVVTQGLLPAATDFRDFLHFFGGALYFSTIGYSQELFSRIAKLYLVAACWISVLVLVRWAGVFAGVDIGVLRWEYQIPIRVLSGPHTFFLAQALFLFVPVLVRRGSTLLQRTTGGTLLVIVLLLNRRTVYLALLLGLALALYFNRELGKRAFKLLLAVAVTAGALLLIAPSETPSGEAVADSPTNTNTFFVYRVESWMGLLVDDSSKRAEEWLIGEPMGAGYERTIRDGLQTGSNPHSFYVQTMLRLGVVGVLALASVYVMAMRRLYWHIQGGDHEAPTALTLFVLLAAQALWFVTWQPGMEQGMLAGIAMAYARQRVTSGPTRIARPVPKRDDRSVYPIGVSSRARSAHDGG